jgi:sulfatase modifying factor 1
MKSKIFVLSSFIILSSCVVSTSNNIPKSISPSPIKSESNQNNLVFNKAKKVEIQILNPKDKSSVGWYKKDEQNIVMKLDAQAELVGTVTLDNGTKSSNVNWSSSDNTIAVVSNGKITSNKIGTTSILAISTVDPSYKSILNVTVVDDANFSLVDSQSINKVKSVEAYVFTDSGKKNDIQVKINTEAQSLAAVTLIDGTKNSNVIWESSDENIATVDSDGKITTKKIGVTSIVAKYKLNPDFKALINIEVVTNIQTTPNISGNLNNGGKTNFTSNPTPTASTNIISNPIIKPTIEPSITPELVLNNENMVLVEGGTFEMGDPLKKTTVTLSSFYIGKYEVTQKDYESVMGNNPSTYKGDDLPVENVSYIDAINYCNKLNNKEGLPPSYNSDFWGSLIDSKGQTIIDATKTKSYRLPTSAEWEFATKGGNLSKGYKYSGSDNLEDIAIFSQNILMPLLYPESVGTKEPNELGLYDMSGNVLEWCSDSSYPILYTSSTLKNPYSYVESGYKMARGGSFLSTSSPYLANTKLYSYEKAYKDRSLGFRIARSM